jgi:hypothetical protein
MFPAMIIVPVMQIAWTLLSIVSGMLYFQEYMGFTVLKTIMFPIGVAVRPPSRTRHRYRGARSRIAELGAVRVQVVFLGVFLLTQSNANKQPSYQKMEGKPSAELGPLDSAAAEKPGPGGPSAQDIGRSDSESCCAPTIRERPWQQRYCPAPTALSRATSTLVPSALPQPGLVRRHAVGGRLHCPCHAASGGQRAGGAGRAGAGRGAHIGGRVARQEALGPGHAHTLHAGGPGALRARRRQAEGQVSRARAAPGVC